MSFNVLTSDTYLSPGLVLGPNNMTLYGTSTDGSNNAIIYSLSVTGGVQTVLYNFNDANTIGLQSYLTVSPDGNTLYGATANGGLNNTGSIFSLDINTQILTPLYSFSVPTGNNNSDGIAPNGGLLLLNDVLYGTCFFGGAMGNGTVFSLPLSAINMSSIYSLSDPPDGENPDGQLIHDTVNTQYIYGTCPNGGVGDNGVIFRYDILNNIYEVIYVFPGISTNCPANAGLLFNGNILYGTTGNNNNALFSVGSGSIFSLTTSGTLTPLYSFGVNEGVNGALIIKDGLLYGTTTTGGINNNGSIYTIPTTADVPTIIYSFDTPNIFPSSGVLLANNELYGTADSIVYDFNLPGIICFDESTSILCLVNEKELYLPISSLNSNSLVKTCKNGYHKINKIGSSTMINDPKNWQNCMYILPKNTELGQTEDLILTGGHSLLVNDITQDQVNAQFRWWPNGMSIVEGKFRLLSFLDARCKQVTERRKFKYYHLVLEGSEDRYGIYANGILAETCPLRSFSDYHFNEVL